jgi:hypothetical protein
LEFEKPEEFWLPIRTLNKYGQLETTGKVLMTVHILPKD